MLNAELDHTGQTIYKNKVWEPWGCPSGWSNPKDVKGAKQCTVCTTSHLMSLAAAGCNGTDISAFCKAPPSPPPGPTLVT